jgi:hypothetical protein
METMPNETVTEANARAAMRNLAFARAPSGAPKLVIVPKCRWRFNCSLPAQHPEDMDYFAVRPERDRNC